MFWPSNLIRCLSVGFLVTTFVLTAQQHAAAAIVLSNLTPSYVQDFDSLASDGTSSVLPDGWFMTESGSSANTTYAAGTGSSATGNTYSFGLSGSSERALGGLLSGSLSPLFGVQLMIQGTTLLQNLQIAYTGEQWRMGAADRLDRLDFQYSTNATSLTTGTWIDLNLLDFIAPVTSGSVGALNGNLPENRTALSGTLTGLNLAYGSQIWLRWQDFDATGSDDGLAIDDVSITGVFAPAEVPEPGSCLVFGILFGATAAFRRSKQWSYPCSIG